MPPEIWASSGAFWWHLELFLPSKKVAALAGKSFGVATLYKA